MSAILEEVRAFGSQEQHDDITLIIAKFRSRE
jgi:serine phosphatase RsbU (regulator of sigma subunit)